MSAIRITAPTAEHEIIIMFVLLLSFILLGFLTFGSLVGAIEVPSDAFFMFVLLIASFVVIFAPVVAFVVVVEHFCWKSARILQLMRKSQVRGH